MCSWAINITVNILTLYKRQCCTTALGGALCASAYMKGCVLVFDTGWKVSVVDNESYADFDGDDLGEDTYDVEICD